jgi:fucose permease
MPRKVDYTAVLIAYVSFIVLGMPGGLIGVLWSPHIRETFSLELDAVATLLLTFAVGYFIASFISGRLFSRFPIGMLLVAGCVISAIAFVGYAVAPSWELIVALGFVAGFGAGILDGGMNIYFAAHFDSRLMNWLHACFGIGSTIAPFVINAVLANQGSWRVGYWMVAALYGITAVLFLLTRTRWLPLNTEADTAEAAQHTSMRLTLQMPIVWIGIAIFALFAGLEAGTGQWSKSIFFEARGIAEAVASNWVAIYWLSFTIGRIVFGFIVQRVAAEHLIRFCLAGATAGMLLFVWNPAPESGLWAVSLFGFTFGPIFAMLVTATQERMGPIHAANAIGFQVAAATLGFGVLPGILGIAGVAFGIETITVTLLVLVIGMAVLYEVWHRMPAPANQ